MFPVPHPRGDLARLTKRMMVILQARITATRTLMTWTTFQVVPEVMHAVSSSPGKASTGSNDPPDSTVAVAKILPLTDGDATTRLGMHVLDEHVLELNGIDGGGRGPMGIRDDDARHSSCCVGVQDYVLEIVSLASEADLDGNGADCAFDHLNDVKFFAINPFPRFIKGVHDFGVTIGRDLV